MQANLHTTKLNTVFIIMCTHIGFDLTEFTPGTLYTQCTRNKLFPDQAVAEEHFFLC